MITSCEFHFGFMDVTAREDAAFGVSDNQPWAAIADINRETPAAHPDVVTLEPGFGWPLDGSRAWFPDDPEQTTWGWWSAQMSRADGSFANPPTLTINFSHNHSSAGITLTFYATLPKEINVKWYTLGGALLANQDYTPDSMIYFCDRQVENYGKVVVTVKSMTAAQRFLRCVHILFGVLEVIDSRRIQKAELTEEIDPVALTLPIQTMLLSFFTAGGRFSLLNPSGAYRLFQWKQQLTSYATVNGVRRPMGVHYLQEAAGAVDNVVELSLVDSVGILDTLTCMGGIYAGKALTTLLDEILGPEGVRYELHSSLANEIITGYLPICTKREALQQVAFAIGAVIDTTRGDVMRIYPAPLAASHSVGPARKIIGHNVKLEELVTQVDVTAHAYRLNSAVRELIRSQLTAGQHTLHFSNPSSVTQITGGILVTSHPNYAVINVTAAGEIVISGREYEDDAIIHTVRTEQLPAGAKSSVKSVIGATLVDRTRAAAVARRVYDYYQRRYTDEGRILPGDERAGQVVELQSMGGRSIAGIVERMVISLSDGCLAKIKMRGA